MSKGAVFSFILWSLSVLAIVLPPRLQAQDVPWVPVDGKVQLADGTAICAMVLANGQYMFSCDGGGFYDLTVPLDTAGSVTLFSFADGFSPFSATIGSGGFPLTVQMQTAAPGSPFIDMTRNAVPAANGWIRITGEIKSSGGDRLCAMVLANGQHMFSCGGSLGRYDLTVPADGNGDITLFGFADGFQPYSATFPASSGGNTGISPGTSAGWLSIYRGYDGPRLVVSVDGSFIETEPFRDPEVIPRTPDLDECVFNVRWQVDVQSRFLDAGKSLLLTREDGSTLPMPDLGFRSEIISYGPNLSVDPDFYQGGQSYSFSGPGGADVGPFETPGVIAPPPMVLTFPRLESPYSFGAHAAAQPLLLRWNGNHGVGEVEVGLSSSGALSTWYTVDCRFVDDGNAEIPAALLLALRERYGNAFSLSIGRSVWETFPGPGVDLNVQIHTVSSGLIDLQ